MKTISGIVLSIAFAFILSCQGNHPEPNYPIIPYVEFRDLKFTPGNASSAIKDTLTLKFYLRDGDFDLGLENNSPPYNPGYVLNKITGQLIPVDEIPADHSDIVTFLDRKTIDTIPSLTCARWTQTYTSQILTDTVYFRINPNYFNLFVDLFSEDNTQAWSYFDPAVYFVFPGCNNNLFNARFPSPPFDDPYFPFKYQATSSKDGIFTYSIASYGLKNIFSGAKIKLRFSIQDRALHRSNVAETVEIQL